jgi:hypothetical protein
MPEIGGLIIEVKTDKMGILSVKSEWIPFYVPIKHDW